VDMTPEMVAKARENARKADMHYVEFRLGEIEHLPLADASVDVIISNCVINLCEDKGAVFREAYRALKPGGRLEVSDVVTSSAFSLEMRANAAEWYECVSGALPEAEYTHLIAQAGFSDIQVRRSASAPAGDGVQVYSAIVSARK
jgi:arsenite methyltransferase